MFCFYVIVFLTSESSIKTAVSILQFLLRLAFVAIVPTVRYDSPVLLLNKTNILNIKKAFGLSLCKYRYRIARTTRSSVSSKKRFSFIGAARPANFSYSFSLSLFLFQTIIHSW